MAVFTPLQPPTEARAGQIICSRDGEGKWGMRLRGVGLWAGRSRNNKVCHHFSDDGQFQVRIHSLCVRANNPACRKRGSVPLHGETLAEREREGGLGWRKEKRGQKRSKSIRRRGRGGVGWIAGS